MCVWQENEQDIYQHSLLYISQKYRINLQDATIQSYCKTPIAHQVIFIRKSYDTILGNENALLLKSGITIIKTQVKSECLYVVGRGLERWEVGRQKRMFIT